MREPASATTRANPRSAGGRGRERPEAACAAARWMAAGLLAASLSPLARGADEPAVAPAPAPTPAVPLDRLFELPKGFETRPSERRRGVGEAEWRTRFAEARATLAQSEAALAGAKVELAEQAESANAWSVAPPVGGLPQGNSDAPMNYELSQRIKRHQRAVDEARKSLLDLEVEANLAGVPDAWRQAPGEVSAP